MPLCTPGISKARSDLFHMTMTECRDAFETFHYRRRDRYTFFSFVCCALHVRDPTYT